jgi:hypothetical protein
VQIDQLLARASDQDFIINTLREALTVKRPSGGTKAALILEELNLHADRIADDDVEPLLTAIFKISDELNVPSDVAKVFLFGDNNLRTHRLLRRLTLERFDLKKRSAIFKAACETAALGWLVDFADSAFNDCHPHDGTAPASEGQCLTTAAEAAELHGKALLRIRGAADCGALGTHASLAYLLYRWRDLAGDGGAEVKQWSDAHLALDEMIIKFAKAFTSYRWSQSEKRDTVPRRTTHANVAEIEAIMNKEKFRARVEELAARDNLAKVEGEIVREFLGAWRRHDKDPRD